MTDARKALESAREEIAAALRQLDINVSIAKRDHPEGPIVNGKRLENILTHTQEILAGHVKDHLARISAAIDAALASGEQGWRTDGDPTVAPGNAGTFIVAVKRAHNGKVWSFPAQFLNGLRLLYDDHPDWCEGEDCDDGCETFGWFSESSEGEYDSNYTPLLTPGDELIAWTTVPQFAPPAPETRS